MSRTAATGRSGSSADLPSRPDRPRQEIGLHKQNQTPAFPAGFPRRVLLPPQCLQGGRTCRAGEVVGRPMVAPTFIAGTAIKFVGAGIAARLSQSSPHLVGGDALMPSEEGCSIPFPPGRRKLHIRSLLLPLRKATVLPDCPSRKALSSERSLRSVHRLSAKLRSRTRAFGPMRASAPTREMERRAKNKIVTQR